MPGTLYDPEPGNIPFTPAPWKPFYHWKFSEERAVWSQSCLRVSEATEYLRQWSEPDIRRCRPFAHHA